MIIEARSSPMKKIKISQIIIVLNGLLYKIEYC